LEALRGDELDAGLRLDGGGRGHLRVVLRGLDGADVGGDGAGEEAEAEDRRDGEGEGSGLHRSLPLDQSLVNSMSSNATRPTVSPWLGPNSNRTVARSARSTPLPLAAKSRSGIRIVSNSLFQPLPVPHDPRWYGSSTPPPYASMRTVLGFPWWSV